MDGIYGIDAFYFIAAMVTTVTAGCAHVEFPSPILYQPRHPATQNHDPINGACHPNHHHPTKQKPRWAWATFHRSRSSTAQRRW